MLSVSLCVTQLLRVSLCLLRIPKCETNRQTGNNRRQLCELEGRPFENVREPPSPVVRPWWRFHFNRICSLGLEWTARRLRRIFNELRRISPSGGNSVALPEVDCHCCTLLSLLTNLAGWRFGQWLPPRVLFIHRPHCYRSELNNGRRLERKSRNGSPDPYKDIYM